ITTFSNNKSQNHPQCKYGRSENPCCRIFFDKNSRSLVKIFSVSFYKKTQNKPTFYSTITYTIQLPKPQIFLFYGKIYILCFEIKKTTTYCGLVACPRGIEPRTEP